MSKNTKIWLSAAVAAVAVYLVYRWYVNRQADQGLSPTGSLGTNLNSVAPELVGGSSGPSVGPAVSLPVTVTITQPVGKDEHDKMPGPAMLSGSFGANPIHMARASALQPATASQSGANGDSALNDAATGMHQQPDDAGSTFGTEDNMDSDSDTEDDDSGP